MSRVPYSPRSRPVPREMAIRKPHSEGQETFHRSSGVCNAREKGVSDRKPQTQQIHIALSHEATIGGRGGGGGQVPKCSFAYRLQLSLLGWVSFKQHLRWRFLVK